MTRRGTVGVLTILLGALGAHPALSGGIGDIGSRQGKMSGKAHGPSLESKVSIQVEGATHEHSGPLTSTSMNWKPPACWYEPYWKAKDFKTYMEAQWSIYDSAGGTPDGIAGKKAHYKEGHPYKDFNAEKNGEGMWWVAVRNPETKGDLAARSCTREPFWVKNGEAPDVPQAIDTETLAGLAYQRTTVPDTKISTAPDGRSTVNAPTWIWLDEAGFKPISAKASLPGTGLWAATTAKPVSLHIDPGTEDAETLPRSGECTINGDGSIGEPYAKGKARRTPPCGVMYLRSSGGSSYPLKATLTWQITWKGAGGTGGDLPNGAFVTTSEMPVQEIQSVNR